MKLNPYLYFDGTCAEAFAFYQTVLGGENLALHRYQDFPGSSEMPAEQQQRIMHACLKVGEVLLMGSDCPPGDYTKPDGTRTNIGLTSVAEAERIYAALSEGALAIDMPLAQTFWSDRFAMFTDKFGTPWMINCACAKPE